MITSVQDGSGSFILANLAMGGTDNVLTNNANWIPYSTGGGTPALPNTRVAFGSALNVMTSDAGFNYTVGTGALDIAGAYKIVGFNFAYSNATNTAVGFGTPIIPVMDGVYNSYFGEQAGNTNFGDRNTFIGGRAGKSHGLGNDNTFIGNSAGGPTNSSTRNKNILIGFAGESAGASSDVISIGYNSGTQNTGTSDVILIGQGAGYKNFGIETILIGHNAGGGLLTGQQGVESIGIGLNALYENLAVDNVIAIGTNAGSSNTGNGSFSIMIGRLAGNANDAYGSVLIGQEAGRLNAGPLAISIGNGAGRNNSGTGTVIIGAGPTVGASAGASNVGNQAVLIGWGAGNTNSGDNVIAIGMGAGNANFATNSVILGFNAGSSQISTGTDSVLIGTDAGFINSGQEAILIGHYAGKFNTGNNLVAIGFAAGMNVTAAQVCVFIGSGAGGGISPITGNANVGIGSSSGGSLTSGASNVFVGTSAGNVVSSGSNNTFVGDSAGNSTTGNDNVCVGYNASGSTSASNQCTIIGSNAGVPANSTRSIALGYTASTTMNNQFALASDVNNTMIYGINYDWIGALLPVSGTAQLTVNSTGALTWSTSGATGITINSTDILSGTPGSVLFINSLGKLGENNTKFFWNEAAVALAIGSQDTIVTVNGVAHQAKFLVKADAPDRADLTVQAFGAGFGGVLYGTHARGTIIAPTTLINGDLLSSIGFGGFDGIDYQNGAAINSFADGVVSVGVMPSNLIFYTNPGNTNVIERIRISPLGEVTINTAFNAGVGLNFYAGNVTGGIGKEARFQAGTGGIDVGAGGGLGGDNSIKGGTGGTATTLSAGTGGILNLIGGQGGNGTATIISGDGADLNLAGGPAGGNFGGGTGVIGRIVMQTNNWVWNGGNYEVTGVVVTDQGALSNDGAGNLSFKALKAGTYTPTATASGNVTTATIATDWQYMNIANVVTVSGEITIDTTINASLSEVFVTLPIASTFIASGNLAGTGATSDYSGVPIAINADTVGNRARLRFIAGNSGSADKYYCTFTYKLT